MEAEASEVYLLLAFMLLRRPGGILFDMPSIFLAGIMPSLAFLALLVAVRWPRAGIIFPYIIFSN